MVGSYHTPLMRRNYHEVHSCLWSPAPRVQAGTFRSRRGLRPRRSGRGCAGWRRPTTRRRASAFSGSRSRRLLPSPPSRSHSSANSASDHQVIARTRFTAATALSIAVSISSCVVKRPRLKRTDSKAASRDRPMAVSTSDSSIDPALQALPEEDPLSLLIAYGDGNDSNDFHAG